MSKKFKIKKGFITQKLGDKLTIFDGENSLLYTFNETASYIFQKLKKGFEKEKIKAALIKKYGLKENRAEKDINEFIGDLSAKKIIM